MSIDYQAAIVVGLHYDDFVDTDPLEKWVADGMLEMFAPYYDAPMEDCVFGLKFERTFSWDTLTLSQGDIHELKSDFLEITCSWPELILTLDVS